MPKSAKPITKELKESLKIKNKTIVEKNLDVAHIIINYLNDKTEKQYKIQSHTINLQKNIKYLYPFQKNTLYDK
ncbi:hypothetical protein CSV63_12855 [Sporosarcina sp. P34]|nr:hypothetical protein CSV63_12855 [Sporosarcina sp. P34]